MRDRKIEQLGNIVDMATFSFHPVKNMTTGEGGMVTTNNKSFYNNLRKNAKQFLMLALKP